MTRQGTPETWIHEIHALLSEREWDALRTLDTVGIGRSLAYWRGKLRKYGLAEKVAGMWKLTDYGAWYQTKFS